MEEEELRVVANNLKSLEVSEEKANQREASNKEQIKTLTAKLKQAEARAEFAEKSVQKLQKEVDRLEDELASEQDKLKGITEELEQTSLRCPATRSTSTFSLLYIRGFQLKFPQRKPHESHITKVILCCMKLYICPM